MEVHFQVSAPTEIFSLIEDMSNQKVSHHSAYVLVEKQQKERRKLVGFADFANCSEEH